jgi:hypothetical protein
VEAFGNGAAVVGPVPTISNLEGVKLVADVDEDGGDVDAENFGGVQIHEAVSSSTVGSDRVEAATARPDRIVDLQSVEQLADKSSTNSIDRNANSELLNFLLASFLKKLVPQQLWKSFDRNVDQSFDRNVDQSFDRNGYEHLTKEDLEPEDDQVGNLIYQFFFLKHSL